MTSETSTTKKAAYDNNYKKENYDQILFRVKKGKREEYRAAADELGLGQMELFRQAVEEFIQRHAGEVNLPTPTPTPTTQPAEQISATQRRLLDAVNQLSADAQKSLIKFLQSLNAQQVNVAAENKAENTAKNASVDAQEPI